MPLQVTVTLFQARQQAEPSHTFTHVHRYRLHEGLNELFSLGLELRVHGEALDPHAIIGQLAHVRLGDEPVHQDVQGLVCSMRQLSTEPTGVSRYELTVVPLAWLGTRRRTHFIHQNMSVAELAQSVLFAGSDTPVGPSPLPRTAFREYCVQYGETDWDFVRRILSEEGMAFTFGHGELGGGLQLLENTTVGSPVLEARYLSSGGMGMRAAEHHVSEVTVSSGIETATASVRDYDFSRPMYVPEGRADATAGRYLREEALEDYHFDVGEFTSDAHGNTIAARRLDSLRALRQVAVCEASFRLCPGSHFVLRDGPEGLPAKLLVVSSRTEASQSATVADGGGRVGASDSTVRHTLVCIPAATRFRPPIEPKPRIWSTQNAFVVGAEGRDIDIDAYGRVEVEFRWDRRDRHLAGICRRVRVTQTWANAGYGFTLHPRVNEEVLVAFIDGDPDEPIIVGRVFDGANTAPYPPATEPTKSAWRSRSSPGGAGYNEVMMEDRAGAELLRLHAHRDFHKEVGRDSATRIGHDETLEIDNDQTTIIHGNKVTIIDGQEQVRVTKGQTTTTEDNITIDSKGTYLQSSEVVQVLSPRFHVFAGGEIHLQSKGSFIDITPGEIHIHSAGPLRMHGTPVEITGGDVVISGGNIKIVGSGDVSVNGGLVKLNCE